MTRLLLGKPVAAELTTQLRSRSDALRARGVTPTLAMIRLGENPGDLAYERGAKKRAELVGVDIRPYTFPADFPLEKLILVLRDLNIDPSVHGILPLRPFPRHISDALVRATISPDKDVDGVSTASMAGLYAGSPGVFAPCTAEACVEILDHYGIDPAGARVTVVGRSLVIGKPVALLLLRRDATVTICHSKTRDLPPVCQEADILITAAGSAGLIGRSCLREGQTILDVSVNRTAVGRLTGDIAHGAVEGLDASVTPVPGGVGTVTSTILMRHVIESAEKAAPED